MNGHICSQVVDIVVMDLVQKTAMCAVLRSQGLETSSVAGVLLCPLASM